MGVSFNLDKGSNGSTPTNCDCAQVLELDQHLNLKVCIYKYSISTLTCDLKAPSSRGGFKSQTSQVLRPLLFNRAPFNQ